jgi:hypothetical protein
MNFDHSFDDKFAVLSNLLWKPWVGENYQKNKVLLIAESHYDDDENWLDKPDATRKMVNNQGLNSQNPKYSSRKIFQGIEQTLLAKKTSTLDERDKLWKNVAFYNLIQKLLPSSTARPTDNDFDIGWSVFIEIANILKPAICIKYGYTGIGRLGLLLNSNDTGWKKDSDLEFKERPYCINLTSKEGHKMKIIFTHHPTGARGFNFAVWANHIKNHWPTPTNLFS